MFQAFLQAFFLHPFGLSGIQWSFTICISRIQVFLKAITSIHLKTQSPHFLREIVPEIKGICNHV